MRILLVDDDTPDGTERIHIRRPVAGLYTIFAHYFDSRGGRPADVTVQILGDDETVTFRGASGTLTGDCDTWKVGTLDWPSGVVILNTLPNTSICHGTP